MLVTSYNPAGPWSCVLAFTHPCPIDLDYLKPCTQTLYKLCTT